MSSATSTSNKTASQPPEQRTKSGRMFLLGRWLTKCRKWIFLEKSNYDQMSLIDHFEELRDRLIRSFVVVIAATFIVATFTDQLLKFLLTPYGEAVIITRPTEGISIYFRVAIIGGLVVAMPYLIYHVIMFIVPGLEEYEWNYIKLGVPVATFLFLIGVSFAWFILLPTAINFLKYWQVEIFKPLWQADEYIPFVTSLVFWIGVSFETPLIIFIMAKVGIVTPRFLAQQWRFAVVIIAIIAAMITPTVDPFNMTLVMAPLMILYGLSIILAYVAYRQRVSRRGRSSQ